MNSLVSRPMSVGARASTVRPARSASLLVSAEKSGSRNGGKHVARRQALFNTVFTGLALTSGSSMAAREAMPEVPEPTAPSQESRATLTQPSTPKKSVSRAESSNEATPVDPTSLLLGAGAVAGLAAVGVAVTNKSDGTASSTAAAPSSKPKAAPRSNKQELKAAEAELKLREGELEKLQAELATVTAAVDGASAAKQAALDVLLGASEKAQASNAEVAAALESVAAAQAKVDKMSKMNGFQKMMAGMNGQTPVKAQAALDEADAQCTSVSSEAMAGNIDDRRAWIAHYRASVDLSTANAAAAAKQAEVSAMQSLVQGARNTIAQLSGKGEPTMEERVKDRQAWIAAYRARSLGETEEAMAPVESTLEARVQDRQLWIAAYKSRNASAAAAAQSEEEEGIDARVADRRAWIAAYKERVNMVVSA